ncbi:MAG TPA: TIGR00297 family protein [Methanocorpusculum sp.]|nr:TIGR00297 family protein [Methanocorpusculum sp.]
MDIRVSRIIFGLCAAILLCISPYISPVITGVLGIVFAAFMYFGAKVRYFSIAVAVLGLLYAISFVPLLAFIGPLVMILAGEGVRVLFKKAGHDILFFGIGSTAALVFTMLYIGETDPLIGALGEIVLLMLRSILTSRNDGSMISYLGVAMTITLFMDLEFLVDFRLLALAILLCAAFGYFAYRAKTIDMSGLFSLILFGVILIVFTGGFLWFFIVLAFFIIGSVFTKFKYAKKKEMGVAQKKSGRRGYKNAFANAGIAIISCILFGITKEPIFAVTFLGSVATATADTLASEIGVVAGGKPRMITTMKPCEPGENGGVTLAGELACLGGSILISVLGFAFGIVPLWGAAAACISGILGTNIDSLIGALFENKGYFGNAGTNLLATLSGGLAAAGIFALLNLI